MKYTVEINEETYDKLIALCDVDKDMKIVKKEISEDDKKYIDNYFINNIENVFYIEKVFSDMSYYLYDMFYEGCKFIRSYEERKKYINNLLLDLIKDNIDFYSYFDNTDDDHIYKVIFYELSDYIKYIGDIVYQLSTIYNINKINKFEFIDNKYIVLADSETEIKKISFASYIKFMSKFKGQYIEYLIQSTYRYIYKVQNKDIDYEFSQIITDLLRKVKTERGNANNYFAIDVSNFTDDLISKLNDSVKFKYIYFTSLFMDNNLSSIELLENLTKGVLNKEGQKKIYDYFKEVFLITLFKFKNGIFNI